MWKLTLGYGSLQITLGLWFAKCITLLGFRIYTDIMLILECFHLASCGNQCWAGIRKELRTRIRDSSQFSPWIFQGIIIKGDTLFETCLPVLNELRDRGEIIFHNFLKPCPDLLKIIIIIIILKRSLAKSHKKSSKTQTQWLFLKNRKPPNTRGNMKNNNFLQRSHFLSSSFLHSDTQC